MDTRSIITVEEENRILEEAAKLQQAEVEAEEPAKDREFCKQWKTMDDYLCCPVGVNLLRRFAEAQPEKYDFFVKGREIETVTAPAVLRHAAWKPFSEHRNTCDDCREI
jgi:hypothetical protein